MDILIVSQYNEIADMTEQLIRNRTGNRIFTVASGNEARRIISADSPPEIVIIDAPLPDEFGHELAVMTAETTTAGVILICNNTIYDDIVNKVSDFDIAVISEPLNREIFSDTIGNLCTAVSSLHRESPTILTRTSEIRLINSAKRTLMEYLKFTESQAHRYIEKQAMNSRCTRLEVAEKIIETYKK